MLLLASCVFAGCGSSTVRCHPVTGTITVGKKPAGQAVVILHPLDASEAISKLRPYGVTNESGRFTLSCMEPNDGAPAGEYDVTITWEAAEAQPASDDPEASVTVPDRLGGKYSNPSTSGLRVTIKAGTNELPPFNL
jgi:hypothetical protein